ncbi:MAG: hypothetical protein HY784_16315, partial [Chloroflexi bacterium]|nr:hypothetical protein [Chloroflexota bacterium]
GAGPGRVYRVLQDCPPADRLRLLNALAVTHPREAAMLRGQLLALAG